MAGKLSSELLVIFVRNFNKTVANYARNMRSVRTFIRPTTEHRIVSFSCHVSVHPYIIKRNATFVTITKVAFLLAKLFQT